MWMRIVLGAVTIALIGCACARGDKKFSEKFGERLCDAYAECRPDVVCETDALGDFEPSDCSYDKEASKDCLDGDFRCNDDFGEGFEFVEIPDVCAAVFTDCEDPVGR